MVELDKFALCMTIWSLKQWLVCPTMCSYLLTCGSAEGLDCRCRNLIRAMLTDENLRKVFEDKTSFLKVQVQEEDADEDEEYQLSMGLQAQMSDLEDAEDQLKDYAWKLLVGHEKIRSGRHENVVSSLQVAKMVEKIEKMRKCVENKIRQNNPDDIHPVMRLNFGFNDSSDDDRFGGF